MQCGVVSGSWICMKQFRISFPSCIAPTPTPPSPPLQLPSGPLLVSKPSCPECLTMV